MQSESPSESRSFETKSDLNERVCLDMFPSLYSYTSLEFWIDVAHFVGIVGVVVVVGVHGLYIITPLMRHQYLIALSFC